MTSALLTLLVLTASLSPLLTFAALWQMKEWRWDRLREHVRETGWGQLVGKVRPALLLLLVLHIFVSNDGSIILLILFAFTGLNILQIFLKKQRYPVWTKKAIMLMGTSVIITAIIGYIVVERLLVIFVPIFQPLILTLALTLFLPLDRFLKNRILQKAKTLRSRFPKLVVIGITGSVGKTTTKELLAHLLQDKKPLVTPEHVNTELGVANWIIEKLCDVQQLSEQVVIIEMGAYCKGEIATLCSMTQPTIGIITMIGSQHLGLFGSQKHIVDAKGELFDALPHSGRAFINAESPFLDVLRKKCQCPCNVIEKKTILKNPRFNADIAIVVAKFLGVNEQQVNEKLATFSLPKHTFSIRKQSNITILDDTHNSSPESFRVAIEWARIQPQKEKILLASGIIELGKESDRIHEELGTLATSVFSKALIVNSSAAKAFAKGFQKPLSPIPCHLSSHSLLCCIGRIPPSLIKKFLS
ncbi:hypothetical protein A3D11_02830 [Candidatus Peribacteria bacterium RIFCSPHIGHO2_02_FULL_49_16]|nr:MAG: hypothetical protein A2880_01730 [Candidatus Peribacteria bacterium RIFCSPHIGHO2_01_FULL_49_38]OGJ58524.1 MAG: hypothetical protein A3D11_02830 [Candidatus Peribacteria bacterium RIFCSPHIGHO2_02_FULL_49_16]